MGWASAGTYFDAVADALIEGGASDELKTKICSVLIGVFRDGDWDTEDESLREFGDHPAIVQAFREHGVFLSVCEAGEPGGYGECALEGGHDGDHDDGRGRTWPQEGRAETPVSMLRRAAASMRDLVRHLRGDMAANDYWACDHPDATEDEIYADGVNEGLGGEAGSFAASWTPGMALAVADWLDAVAGKAEELDGLLGVRSAPVGDPVWDAALKSARAFLSREERAGA